VVVPPSRPAAPVGVAGPSRRRVGSARWVGRPWLAPLSLVVERGDSTNANKRVKILHLRRCA